VLSIPRLDLPVGGREGLMEAQAQGASGK